jgi:hypothetical protein
MRDHLGENITITGQPYSADREHDWFLLAVDGTQIQAAALPQLEYNSNRFLANRSDEELACIAGQLDAATYQALLDSRIDLIDLTSEELNALIACEG